MPLALGEMGRRQQGVARAAFITSLRKFENAVRTYSIDLMTIICLVPQGDNPHFSLKISGWTLAAIPEGPRSNIYIYYE